MVSQAPSAREPDLPSVPETRRTAPRLSLRAAMFGRCRRQEECGGAAAASRKACPQCVDKEYDDDTYTINMAGGRVYTYSIKKDGGSFNIVQVEDGSRNRVTCASCGCRFCWLCTREVPHATWHFWGPSTGCAPGGKAIWSRRKNILWMLGSMLGSVPGCTVVASAVTYALIPHLIVAGAPLWAVLAVAVILGVVVGKAGLYVRRRMKRVH